MSTLPPRTLPLASARDTIYNATFWLAYGANVVLVMANALSFQFAEWVKHLGGSEQLTGSIVSAGLIGALVLRLAMGQFIDRYGAGRLWAISSACFIIGCVAFTQIHSLGWPIYAARVLFSISLAGMFTCSIVHIQNQVPAERRTEVIGNLGSSGFVGMILGAQLGDFIFRTVIEAETKFLILFSTAAALGLVHMLVAVLLTRGQPHERPAEHVSALRLLARYWPGPVVVVALLMGITFGVTTIFLRRFSTEMGLAGIGTFFTAYSISAFVFRITSASWSQKYGRHAMILRGLAGHFVAMCGLCLVTREWHLVFPAIAGGYGHALLFPAVISIGSGSFPRRYRGMGTTLSLGFVEAGTMLSAPLLGAIIDRFGDNAALKFGFIPMYGTAAGLVVCVAAFYFLTAARHPDIDAEHVEDREFEFGEAGYDREEDAPVAAPFPHLGRNT